MSSFFPFLIWKFNFEAVVASAIPAKLLRYFGGVFIACFVCPRHRFCHFCLFAGHHCDTNMAALPGKLALETQMLEK